MAARWMTRIMRGLGALTCLVMALGLMLATDASSAVTSVAPDIMARAGSSDVVYLLATTTCRASGCLRLYRTNMQGSSFTSVTLPPRVTWGGMGNRTFNNVSFATPKDGYAFVGPYDASVVYVTTNGARSWHQLKSLNDLVGSIHLTDSGLFAMTAQCSLTTTNCDNYRVWRSSLNAKKWTLLPTLWKAGTDGRYYNYPPEIAASRNYVWELETAPNGVAYLWTSINRGRTFSRVEVSTPELVSVSGCSLTAMSTRELWAECPTGMQVSFWHSDDGGATWHAVTDSAYQYMGTGGGAFDPLSANVAMLDYGGTARHPNLFRITEGGARFTPIRELSCNNAAPLIFANVSDGLVLCSQDNIDTTTAILRTSNGGVTWSNVTLPRE